jgi:hypothetical protein
MLTKIQNKLARKKDKLELQLYKNFNVLTRQSPYDNIYYCCSQRTASQWFKAVFYDRTFYKYTRLEVLPFKQLGNPNDFTFNEPFPKHTMVTHLYIGYPSYLSIPKPETYKTFFVLRDPRDIVVSWYFSTKNSHAPMGEILQRRKELDSLSLSEGLKYTIDILNKGTFESQKSWLQGAEDKQNMKIFRYEDLADDHRSFLSHLFNYLDIALPEKEFSALCERHKYESYSKGRSHGSEDINAHYRKGIAGDWKNYFDNSTIAYFKEVTKDLLEVLGYQE